MTSFFRRHVFVNAAVLLARVDAGRRALFRSPRASRLRVRAVRRRGRRHHQEGGVGPESTDEDKHRGRSKLVLAAGLCTHVDDEFLAQLTQLYASGSPPGVRCWTCAACGSATCRRRVSTPRWWATALTRRSSKNRRLSRFFVKNLNENPTFAAEDQTYDTVLCCVSVQYLQRPEEVFAEVYRVLKPGGVFIVSSPVGCSTRRRHLGVARRRPDSAGRSW